MLPFAPRITLSVENLEVLDLELGQQNREIDAGVIVQGPAAAYALVWEWGNARQTKKGPKTTWGVNPDGKGAWLTLQAPRGYVRVYQGQYAKILENEVSRVRFSGTSTLEIADALAKCVNRAADKCAAVVAAHAPVDSGQLEEGIVSVHFHDPILSRQNDSELVVANGIQSTRR